MASTANQVVGDPRLISITKTEFDDQLRQLCPTRATSPLIDALAGGISGMVGVFAGSPFDVIKARMQNSHTPVRLLTVVNQTLQKEGATALWKGVTPPLLAEGALNHVWFGVYALMASVFRPDPHMELPFSQAFIAGGVAGLVGSIIVTPTDLVKIQSQVNESTGADRKRPMHIIKEIYNREGIWGFTRGLSAVIIRDIPGLGMFFGCYNGVRNLFRRSDGTISGFGQILSGGTSGIGSWIVSYPFDVIKTRMQVSTEGLTTKNCMLMMYRQEGLLVFYRGIFPCLIGSFPINAAIFFIYELLIQASWNLENNRMKR